MVEKGRGMFCKSSIAGAPMLLPDEVHVSCVRLDYVDDFVDSLAGALGEDERDRAGRYHFERDRRRYIAGRGALRFILGTYLDIAPKDIRLAYGPCGKPELACRQDAWMTFNLSHSGAWGVYAFARRRALGIDVETFGNGNPWQQLAPAVFNAAELAELDALPSAEKPAAFLRGWTRKEAYVKGHGAGLSLPLHSFDVPLAAEGGPWTVKAALVAGASPWWLYPLGIAEGCIASLAVQGPQVRIKTVVWPDLAGQSRRPPRPIESAVPALGIGTRLAA